MIKQSTDHMPVTVLPDLRITSKTIPSLVASERQRLKKLTLPSGSYMQAILDDNPETAVCWLAYLNQDILGWSLLFWFPPDIFGRSCSYISVFVDPLNRGNGLGRELIAEAVYYAQNHAMKPWFFGGSKEQVTFYKACHVQLTRITSHPFLRNPP